MKSLIIGAAGFVGGHLIKHLKEDLGWEVSATKLPHESIDRSDIEVFDLDILDAEAVKELFIKVTPDYIFHLAAQSSVSLSWKNPDLTIDINIKGSLNVLEAIRNLDFKPRLLLIGSGEEYGHVLPTEVPITEENVLRPGNLYAATKATQGMLGKIYSDAYGIDAIMVRAFNHIGPGQAPTFVVSDFCQQVAEIEAGKRKPVMNVGNLTAMRDFTDVRDVVRAYAALIQKGIKGETYNVGSGKAVAVKDVLSAILKEATVPIKIEVDESKLRPVDVPIIEANIKKLAEATGWERSFDLQTTIKDTLNYWRARQ